MMMQFVVLLPGFESHVLLVRPPTVQKNKCESNWFSKLSLGRSVCVYICPFYLHVAPWETGDHSRVYPDPHSITGKDESFCEKCIYSGQIDVFYQILLWA